MTGRLYLTEMQRQCVRLAACGYEGPEIAAKLYLSHHTVRSHLIRARKTVGAHNTAALVAIAVLAGYVTAEHLAQDRREDA